MNIGRTCQLVVFFSLVFGLFGYILGRRTNQGIRSEPAAILSESAELGDRNASDLEGEIANLKRELKIYTEPPYYDVRKGEAPWERDLKKIQGRWESVSNSPKISIEVDSHIATIRSSEPWSNLDGERAFIGKPSRFIVDGDLYDLQFFLPIGSDPNPKLTITRLPDLVYSGGSTFIELRKAD